MYVSHKSNPTVVKSEFISTDLIEEEYDVQFVDIGQDVLFDCLLAGRGDESYFKDRQM